jgi:hypothetical protein
MRVFAYVMQVLAEDEETQKQGAVMVFWPLDPDVSIDPEAAKMLEFLPIRFSAMHVCFSESQRFRAIAMYTVLSVLPEMRARTRIHVGKKPCVRLCECV